MIHQCSRIERCFSSMCSMIAELVTSLWSSLRWRTTNLTAAYVATDTAHFKTGWIKVGLNLHLYDTDNELRWQDADDQDSWSFSDCLDGQRGSSSLDRDKIPRVEGQGSSSAAGEWTCGLSLDNSMWLRTLGRTRIGHQPTSVPFRLYSDGDNWRDGKASVKQPSYKAGPDSRKDDCIGQLLSAASQKKRYEVSQYNMTN